MMATATDRPWRRGFHWIFEWDKVTGFSCDRVNYGPYNCSSCSWIVPGTIDDDPPTEEEVYHQGYDDEEEDGEQ
jgi:hypothetical protein